MRPARPLYRWLAGGIPERTGMSRAQRRAMPRNFLAYVGSLVLTKLGDALMNPKTTLAWMASALGAPTWVGGALTPLRESGSMVLQFAVAAGVRRLSRRKWAWVLGSIVQGAAVAAMGLIALTLSGATAGYALLGLVALFALARSFCSVAVKDVLGRTQPEGRRGAASGWSAGIAGLATVGVGAAAAWLRPQALAPADFAVLLATAGALWWLAAAGFATVREPAGNDDAGARPAPLSLLRDDPLLRRFVIVRALLMCSALSGPYYVMLAHRHLGDGARPLALFIALGGAASLLGGPLGGRIADRSSRRLMLACGLLAAVLALALAIAEAAGAPWLGWLPVLPGLYLLLALAHQGVRVGRSTYVVDIAGGERRTDYVAVSNSAIGALLLPVGGIVAAIAQVGIPWALATLAAMGVAAAVLGLRLPEAEAGGDTGPDGNSGSGA